MGGTRGSPAARRWRGGWGVVQALWPLIPRRSAQPHCPRSQCRADSDSKCRDYCHHRPTRWPPPRPPPREANRFMRERLARVRTRQSEAAAQSLGVVCCEQSMLKCAVVHCKYCAGCPATYGVRGWRGAPRQPETQVCQRCCRVSWAIKLGRPCSQSCARHHPSTSSSGWASPSMLRSF